MQINSRIAAGAIALLWATSASATTISFQENVLGYVGTTTVEIGEINADMNKKGADTNRLSVDLSNSETNPAGETQALIRFDNIFGVVAIPTTGVVIQSASLRFWTVSDSDGPVTIHQMITDWNMSDT